MIVLIVLHDKNRKNLFQKRVFCKINDRSVVFSFFFVFLPYRSNLLVFLMYLSDNQYE